MPTNHGLFGGVFGAPTVFQYQNGMYAALEALGSQDKSAVVTTATSSASSQDKSAVVATALSSA